MKYCTKCVIPSTRPHIEFDSEGVCSACRTAEAKIEEINWGERREQLERIFAKFRKDKPGEYDCIVPVSGGKDSIYQVATVVNDFGMNPLCVTFRSLARTPRGEENLQALRNIGVDHIDISPNPKGVNAITRQSFFEFGDSSLLDHLAIYNTVPNFAARLNIPLVIWGENFLMEYGGSKSDSDVSEMHRNFFAKHDILKGTTAEYWAEQGIPANAVQAFMYPSDEVMDQLGYTPIFLGYFIPWDAKHNVEVAEQYGFKRREEGPIMGLYDYADLDCMNIVIHHYFKWLKFGFNRITDNGSNEIRKGRMSRDEVIALMRTHEGLKPPKSYIEAFCRQIDITVEQFWEVAEKFRNHDIWKKDENNEWYIQGWIAGDKIPDRFPHVEA